VMVPTQVTSTVTQTYCEMVPYQQTVTVPVYGASYGCGGCY